VKLGTIHPEPSVFSSAVGKRKNEDEIGGAFSTNKEEEESI
jgi:hypothetical protein